jgi:chromosome segregation ATPase
MPGPSVTRFEHVAASPGIALLRIAGSLRPGIELGDARLVIARGSRSERHVALDAPDSLDARTGHFQLAFAVPDAALAGARTITLEVGGRPVELAAPRARILPTAGDREHWGAHVAVLGDRLAQAHRRLEAAEAAARGLGSEVAGAQAAARRAVVRARKLEMRLHRTDREIAELERALVAARSAEERTGADRTWTAKLEADLTAERRVSAALRRQAVDQADALAASAGERASLVDQRDEALARIAELERALATAHDDVRRLEHRTSELLGQVDRLTIAEGVLRSEARDRIAGLTSRLARLEHPGAGAGAGAGAAVATVADELDGVSRELGAAREQLVQASEAGRESAELERRLAETSSRLDAERRRTRDLESQVMRLRAGLSRDGDGHGGRRPRSRPLAHAVD